MATDYAGLGVSQQFSGQPIVHEYLAPPGHAKDIVHSVTAARAAFPELSQDFVVIGHSQGGGAACSAAQRAALTLIPGYLGAVAVSPYTNLLELELGLCKTLTAAISSGVASAFPEFNPQDLLTAEGQKRLDIIYQTSAATHSMLALLVGADLLKPNWRENVHLQQYVALTSNGGKAIKGRLLITHGTLDPLLSVGVVENAIKRTVDLFPSSQIEYASLFNVTHLSALQASQRLRMDWIGDRFARREVQSGCRSYELPCARPDASRQMDPNWHLQSNQPLQAKGP